MPDETQQNRLQSAARELADYHAAIRKGRIAGSVDRRMRCDPDPCGWFEAADLPVTMLTVFTEHYELAYAGKVSDA